VFSHRGMMLLRGVDPRDPSALPRLRPPWCPLDNLETGAVPTSNSVLLEAIDLALRRIRSNDAARAPLFHDDLDVAPEQDDKPNKSIEREPSTPASSQIRASSALASASGRKDVKFQQSVGH
jgi:hypothetical protein